MPRSRDEHKFHIRVWFEPRETPGQKPVLRGEITRIPTGELRYFSESDALGKAFSRWLKAPGRRSRWLGLPGILSRLMGRHHE